jgi:peptidoglycan/xylan/chitin deacetylase (PgdA/CDA1 family)
VAALNRLSPPVLCYHRIGGPLELGVTRVGRSVFAGQMRALARAGWRTVSLDEFASPRTTHHAPRTFLLTFDDGYASLARHAYPVLADLGFTATTFLITDFVGKTNTWDVRYTWNRLSHLSWPEIEQWQERGFEFASHGATHRRLTWLPDGEALDDLSRSRELLQSRLGSLAARAIAYPFGAVDDRVTGLAARAGYRLGFGGVQGGTSVLNRARVPVYVWDVFCPPMGLRPGRFGALGRRIAHIANRCAVGTSIMLSLCRREEREDSRFRRNTSLRPESVADGG